MPPSSWLHLREPEGETPSGHHPIFSHRGPISITPRGRRAVAPPETARAGRDAPARPKTQASQGGGRNWLDPNDYYDVYGGGQTLVRDGVIDLPNDILGVIQHFAPLPGGAPPYDVRFDRGPQIGPNVWNMGPPDGVIDLPNDILGVIQQFQHDCR